MVATRLLLFLLLLACSGCGASLLMAAKDGNVQGVRSSLDGGARINMKDDKGLTPLGWAASRGHTEVVRLLLDRGADIQSRSSVETTPLHEASFYGHTDVARLLLDRGADINARSQKGVTPLHNATGYGHLETARLLLERGADPRAQSTNGATPLLNAANKGNTEIVNLLLERGVDVNAINLDGVTPLMQATFQGHREVVSLLLNKGAEVNAQASNNGGFALNNAAIKGNQDIVRLLLDSGADPNLEASCGCTALMSAAANGRVDLGGLLVDRKADPNATDIQGVSALMRAAYHGHLEMVRFLLDRGANVNGASDTGVTALHNAAFNGHAAVVQLLLDRGANPHASTETGITPLTNAKNKGHAEVARLLQQAESTSRPFAVGTTVAPARSRPRTVWAGGRPNAGNRIKTLAVLPFINNSNDVDAPAILQEEFSIAIGKRFYSVKPTGEVNQTLKDQLGITLGTQLNLPTPRQICDAIETDGLLYGSLEDYSEKMTGAYNIRRVRVRTKLVSCQSGLVIWRNGAGAKTEVVPQTSQRDGELGMAIAAIGLLGIIGSLVSDATEDDLPPILGDRVPAPWLALPPEPQVTTNNVISNLALGMVKTVADQATKTRLARERHAVLITTLDGFWHPINVPGWNRAGIPRGPIAGN